MWVNLGPGQSDRCNVIRSEWRRAKFQFTCSFTIHTCFIFWFYFFFWCFCCYCYCFFWSFSKRNTIPPQSAMFTWRTSMIAFTCCILFCSLDPSYLIPNLYLTNHNRVNHLVCKADNITLLFQNHLGWIYLAVGVTEFYEYMMKRR